jgi:hypothetical protein
MSVIYYFKHGQVMNLFEKSQIDFQSDKHLFNNQIYRLAGAGGVEVISAYFRLLREESSEVSKVAYMSEEVDWAKVLGLKQSKDN